MDTQTATAAPVSTVVGLIAVLALVLANAYFVAAEFALVGARKTRLEEASQAGDRKATRALGAIQHLDRYISATQLGITLASLGLGWVGEPALAHLFEGLFRGVPEPMAFLASHTAAVAAAFTIITTLHIVLGELVPKSLALLYPEDVSRWVIWPLMGFSWVMHYPISLLNGLAVRLLRLAGVAGAGEHDRLHSPEEIRMLVEQSGQGGSLTRGDARMLEGVFEFSEKSAQDVMTPRTDIIGLAADATVEEAADVVAGAGRSRYPVYTSSLDEIVGVVLAKDILRALRDSDGIPLRRIMREPLLVPGTREVEDVLADMKRLKTHLAVVLDEYGGTAGLVTMEDLLEEIVGEIYDEYDPETSTVVAATDGTVSLEASLPITAFNDRFDVELPADQYTTLGGFLFGQLGRLPKVGDRIATEGYLFEITAMDARRVETVRVRREA
ncbi:MAG: hemolysin family protein [Gemmatimonadota bacterium]